MKRLASQFGKFLLEVVGIAIKTGVAAIVATTLVIYTARYLHVLWL